MRSFKRPLPKIWGGAFFCVAAVSLVQGVPPVSKDFDPGGPTCFLNKRLYKARAAHIQGDSAFHSLVTLSTPSVLVIRVDFSDEPMTLGLAQTESFFERVRGFYLENSYGMFRPTFTVTSTVHTVGVLATYGTDCGSDIACRTNDLRQAAVQMEDAAGRDFSAFHHVMIYHAGNGQESSGVGQDIWSVFLSNEFQVDGNSFEGFTTVPEKEANSIDALGVICHEYGHQLGLPDLYDISFSGGASTVGKWDVMDYPYGAEEGGPVGGNPSHFGAWSKKFLGFLTPVVLQVSANPLLFSSSVSSQVFQIPAVTAAAGPNNEYFLLEYRNINSTATYDKGLPGSGLLIWHVDDSIALDPSRIENNDVNSPSLSGQGHRGVDLVEADGTEVYIGSSRGESGDAFSGDAFSSARQFLSPQSDAFNGVPTGVFVSAISGLGGDALDFQVELPSLSTFTLTALVSLSTTLATAFGSLTVEIPVQTVESQRILFLSALSESSINSLESGSYVTQLEETGAGFIAALDAGAQPRRPVAATLSFASHPTLSTLSVEDKRRLVLARYEAQSRVWVPLPSLVDPSGNTLRSDLNHFSLFQIMRSQAALSFSNVKIFPNPMRPSLDATYAFINFSNLPVDSTVRLYTLDGNLVREIRPDFSGLAVWDGRNFAGREVASGVYFAVYEDQDGHTKKRAKVAIER